MSKALVYPGQGSQYVGMGMELAERYPIAREVLEQADDALNFALSDIISNGPDTELLKTDISQPAILTVSWMSHCVLEKTMNPLEFTSVAGLSLGEYTALVAAEALSFKDAVKLVRIRGEAMQEAALLKPSSMVALMGADEESATKLCDAAKENQILQVANLNTEGQVVISGEMAACERAINISKDFDIRRARPLSVAGAFHSELMQPAVEKLKEALENCEFSNPIVPVYSNVTAKPVTSAQEIPDLLLKQLTSTVRWSESITNMEADGINAFYELGPGKTLSGMIARTASDDVKVSNLDKASDVLRLAQE